MKVYVVWLSYNDMIATSLIGIASSENMAKKMVEDYISNYGNIGEFWYESYELDKLKKEVER